MSTTNSIKAKERNQRRKQDKTHIDVVLELRGDGNDGRLVGNRSLHERADLVVLLLGLLLLDDVHLKIILIIDQYCHRYEERY